LAGPVTEEFCRLNGLRRGPGFGAQEYERSFIKARRILRHELGWKIAPDLDRRAEVLEPVLQTEHDAIGRPTSDQIDAIDLAIQPFAELRSLNHCLCRGRKFFDDRALIHFGCHC
jgi:hypothetical protein